ncbi:hypothetical protein ILUMI_09489 [Ignelater luminosus]|uniref:Lipase domain-containing protein n=1 Tax=Ignelater luminosus TaxID=2038154 RepID=A0A8K0D5Q1_IGNLU|nr:hypothetical protein ILUMI_09489 [Ignelater luminosus]
MLDWSGLALRDYLTSVCFLPKIARIVAGFLCGINNQRKMSLRSVHLVGISLGGQMSGLIGQETKSICKEDIGRITALDPAGPLFQGLPVSQRVDKTDAIFVDVIHTNKGVLGYYGNCGDVDFYPNCGIRQNGCPLEARCDHLRSLDYMIESIHSNNFKARSCRFCPLNCNLDNSNKAKEVMGENCSTNTSSGAYALQTNPRTPFAIG